jgi:hypothetical protein
MRDLYVHLMSSKVHVHMAGPEATGPTFVVTGVSGIANAEAEAQKWTNDGIGRLFTLSLNIPAQSVQTTSSRHIRDI